MLQDAKKYKTIITNIYKRHFFICDITINIKQNRFKEIVLVK
jgi:hypothetical protein